MSLRLIVTRMPGVTGVPVVVVVPNVRHEAPVVVAILAKGVKAVERRVCMVVTIVAIVTHRRVLRTVVVRYSSVEYARMGAVDGVDPAQHDQIPVLVARARQFHGVLRRAHRV